MLGLKIDKPNRGLTDEELDQLQKYLNSILPEPYSRFLLYYNGGIPYNNTLDVNFTNSEGLNRFFYNFVITRFLGFNTKGMDDLIKTKENLKNNLPSDYLPIAVDHFHNLICLDLSNGKVYFYDLRNAMKNAKPGEPIHFKGNLYLIAESFEEMMDHLYHRRFN